MSNIPVILNERAVRQVIAGDDKPIGRTTLWRLQHRDPDFPSPFKIGNKLRWYEAEIAAYLNSRPRRQYVVEGDET